MTTTPTTQLRACTTCNAVYLARVGNGEDCPKCTQARDRIAAAEMYRRTNRERQYRARWDTKAERAVVLHGLDGMGKPAYFYEAEMVDLLTRGWMKPGACVEWLGVNYIVAGCEFWPQWLERMGKA